VKNYPDVKFILAAVASAAKQPHKKLMFPSREKLCHTKIYASSSGRQHQCLICFLTREQELSYRKQIARQLRTQYVEGIHGPKYYTVTLKSRLRVSQVQWKRNHWSGQIIHDLVLVELFDVTYYREFEMWVRGHSSSLKVVPFKSLGTVSYSPSIATMAVSAAILEIFSGKEWRDLEIWVWGP